MRTARLAEAYRRGRAGDHPKPLRTATGATAAYDLVNGLPCDVTPLIEAELRRWAEPTGNELPVGSEAEAQSHLADLEPRFAHHAESHAAAPRAGIDSSTDRGYIEGGVPLPGWSARRCPDDLEQAMAVMSRGLT